MQQEHNEKEIDKPFWELTKIMKKLLLNLYLRILATQKFANLNTALFHLSMRGLGILNYENTKVSGEKFLITNILPKVITSDKPVFIDVGANTGNYSLALLDQYPGASIHAIEPHPINYSRLTERMPSSKVKNHNIAIGERGGKLTLYDRADFDGSPHASLHKGVISEIHKQEINAFEVVVETLDDFITSERVDHIDLIKIDTEGNEFAVLRGASKILEQGKLDCIQFEFNEMNIVSRVFFNDFRRTLYNYELYRLLPRGLLPICDSPLETELFAFQNIFAIHKRNSGKF